MRGKRNIHSEKVRKRQQHKRGERQRDGEQDEEFDTV